MVGKSSTCLAGVKGRGVFTCVRWQVTLCDPIWKVTLRRCVMEFIPLTAYSTFTFTFTFYLYYYYYYYYYWCICCCRGTVALGSSSRVQCTLQAATPAAKHDWLLALQNVKLALGRLTFDCHVDRYLDAVLSPVLLYFLRFLFVWITLLHLLSVQSSALHNSIG